MKELAAVALGGATGSVLRYLVGLGALRLSPGGFPLGTFLVNVIGCLVMGGVLQATLQEGVLSSTWKLAITVGLLGGFTTYSSFNQETLQLWRSGDATTAIGYFALTAATCLGASVLGALAYQRAVA